MRSRVKRFDGYCAGDPSEEDFIKSGVRLKWLMDDWKACQSIIEMCFWLAPLRSTASHRL